MAQTIYASFPTAAQCEQAAGALLDYGVRQQDISIVSHESYRPGQNINPNDPNYNNTRTGDTMGDAARRGVGTVGNDVAYAGDRASGAAAGMVGANNTAANYETAADQRATIGTNSGNVGAPNYNTNPGFFDNNANAGGAVHQGVNRAGNDVAYTGDRAAGAVAGAAGATNAAANYEASADERAGMVDAGYRGGELRGSGAVLDRPAGAYGTGTDFVDTTNTSRTGSVDNLSYGDAAAADRSTVSDYNAADRDANRAADDKDIEGAAKHGLSVTTGADASAGAAKGAGIGLGLGILAGIAALAVPGVGWVVGGGALATAIGGIIGTTVAGAVAGGVTGYLKDQGVPAEVAANYDQTIQQGGAMLAVAAPSNNVDAITIQQVLEKYGASNVNAY